MIEQDYGYDTLALKKYDGDVEGEKNVNSKIKEMRDDGRVSRKKTLPSKVTLDDFLEK